MTCDCHVIISTRSNKHIQNQKSREIPTIPRPTRCTRSFHGIPIIDRKDKDKRQRNHNKMTTVKHRECGETGHLTIQCPLLEPGEETHPRCSSASQEAHCSVALSRFVQAKTSTKFNTQALRKSFGVISESLMEIPYIRIMPAS
jgi:hypothetical protein